VEGTNFLLSGVSLPVFFFWFPPYFFFDFINQPAPFLPPALIPSKYFGYLFPLPHTLAHPTHTHIRTPFKEAKKKNGDDVGVSITHRREERRGKRESEREREKENARTHVKMQPVGSSGSCPAPFCPPRVENAVS